MKNKEFKYVDLLDVFISKDVKELKIFIDIYGLDSKDKCYGRSILHHSITDDENNFAKMLIEIGADVNSQDKGLVTPLHAAIYAANIEMIDCLLADKRVDIHMVDSYGADALVIAFKVCPKDTDFIIRLLQHGSDPYHESKNGFTMYDKIKQFESGERTFGDGSSIDFATILAEIAKLDKK